MEHVTPERKFIELLLNNPRAALAVDHRYTAAPALGISYRNDDGFTFMEAVVMGESRQDELDTSVRFVNNSQILDMMMYDIGVRFKFRVNGATYIHWAIMEPRMRAHFLETCFPDVDNRRTVVCTGYFLSRVLQFFTPPIITPENLMDPRIAPGLGFEDRTSLRHRLGLFIRDLESQVGYHT